MGIGSPGGSQPVIAVVIVMLVAVACTSGGNAGSSSATIDVMVSGDPEELQAFRDVADAFEAGQGAVEVNLIEIADRDELIAKLSTSLAAGSPPDAFLMNYRYIGQFFAKGVLDPVQPRLDASTAFAESDFYPQALDAFRFDGQLVCLPQNISSLVTYYNEDLFEAADLEFPKAGWTWDQMVEAAEALTVDTTGDGAPDTYGLGVDPDIIRLAPFVWSNGAQVVDDEEHPERFALTSPNAILPMQEFFDLRRVDGVTPTDLEAESEDFESRFLNGRLGMLLDSRKVVPALRTITDFGWDVAPLPVFREPATMLHSDAYCMTEASDRQDATWRFLEFALGPEGQRIAAATGRTVPSMRSVAESKAFLDPGAEPANAQVFLDAIPAIRRVPHISTWPEIEDAANGLLEEGYYSGAGAQEVAVEINRVTKPLFDRAEG